MISKNALIGYMFGLVYFLLCLGFKNMSFMYLFSETFGFPFYFKLIQFSISILVSIITIYITKSKNLIIFRYVIVFYSTLIIGNNFF